MHTVCQCLVTHQITSAMGGVVKSMDAALKSMNLEKVSACNNYFGHVRFVLDMLVNCELN